MYMVLDDNGMNIQKRKNPSETVPKSTSSFKKNVINTLFLQKVNTVLDWWQY